jgi:hypothetical protein
MVTRKAALPKPPNKNTPAAKPKAAPKRKPAPRPKQAGKKKPATLAADPTSDAALLALGGSFSDSPDMPVAVAQRELASLARLARAQHARLERLAWSRVAPNRAAG